MGEKKKELSAKFHVWNKSLHPVICSQDGIRQTRHLCRKMPMKAIWGRVGGGWEGPQTMMHI